MEMGMKSRMSMVMMTMMKPMMMMMVVVVLVMVLMMNDNFGADDYDYNDDTGTSHAHQMQTLPARWATQLRESYLERGRRLMLLSDYHNSTPYPPPASSSSSPSPPPSTVKESDSPLVFPPCHITTVAAALDDLVRTHLSYDMLVCSLAAIGGPWAARMSRRPLTDCTLAQARDAMRKACGSSSLAAATL